MYVEKDTELMFQINAFHLRHQGLLDNKCSFADLKNILGNFRLFAEN